MNHQVHLRIIGKQRVVKVGIACVSVLADYPSIEASRSASFEIEEQSSATDQFTGEYITAIDLRNTCIIGSWQIRKKVIGQCHRLLKLDWSSGKRR